MLETTPKLTGNSPSGKANRLLCANFKNGSCQREIHVMIGMFPHVRKSKLQVDTAKLAVEKRNSASTAVHSHSIE